MELNLSHAGPRGRAIIERDYRALSTSYTREYALVIDHAEGSEVWDVDGRRYIDLMAGVAVLNVGHRHPYVVDAVKRQLDEFWHICLSDFFYPEAVDLAEKLQTIAPMSGPKRVFLTNSGTEAVEAAIKLAMHKTERFQFVGFLGAFHGRTLGALSFTASKSVQRAYYHLGLPVYHVPYPNAYRPALAGRDGESYGERVVDYIENELFRQKIAPTDVAGILVEPILGEGGYVVPAPGFFHRLRELCNRYGIVLIVDEVQSGAGRTGRWWAVEHEGIEPDIVCFAKGIGSGMPIGGIIAREELMEWGPGAHGSTYGGNPVASVSALATIEVIEKEGLLDQATETGEYIRDALCEMEVRHPSIGDVRGRGLMIGVEFVRNKETRERAPEVRKMLNELAFQKGILLLPCGTNSMRLTPPMNIPRHLVDEGLAIFEEALTEAEKACL